MTETLNGDVVVAGAGPAGIAAALRLAQRGVRDVVLLDAQDYPRDKTCGSGLSPRGIAALRELGIWEQVAPHAYPIHGMVLTTPGDRKVDLPSEGLDVAVCLRRVLDFAMLQAARDLGVRFVPRFKVSELITEGGRAVGVRAEDGREARGRQVVAATGAHTKLALDNVKHHQISTIMGWWEGVPFRPNWLEMVYDRSIAPYYGWLFPEGPDRVNIGITYHDPQVKVHARELFERFLNKHYGERLKGATRIGGYRGHPIVFAYNLPRLTSPGRLVIGEAGRMTHPATGEGISQGMRSGMMAADTIASILHRGVPERLAYAGYEAKCRLTFTPSFLAGGAFLKLAQTPMLDLAADLSKDRRWEAVTRLVFSSI